MTTITRWTALLCGAMLALAPAFSKAEEPAKAAKPAAAKNEGKKKKSIQEPWLKGIELTTEQTREIEELNKTYDPQIKERQEKVDALVAPAKLKEVAAKMKTAREEGKRGQELKDLRTSLLGLTAEQAAEFKGLQDNLNIAKNELQAKTRLVLTEEQRKVFDENVAKAKPGAGNKKKNAK